MSGLNVAGELRVPATGDETDAYRIDKELVTIGGIERHRQRVASFTDDIIATGTLTNLNDAVTLAINGRANVTFQIVHSGWTGTVTFEATNDSTWVPIYGFYAGTGQSKTSYDNSASGALFRCSTAGFSNVRIRLSTLGSGTATIYSVASVRTSGVFLNFPLPQGDNMIGSVGTPEFAITSNAYALNGKRADLIELLGKRRQWVNSTEMHDVCEYLVGGQIKMNTPSPTTTYYAVSTSAQDATGGSGVDRIKLAYLDAGGYEQLMTVSINGTTPVSIGSGLSFSQFMESDHSTATDRVAAGDITISSVNGVATEATTIEMIKAGGNRSRSLRYKVPTGRHAHIIDYHASAIKLTGGSNTFEFQSRATIWNNVDDGLSNSFHFLRGATITDGGDFTDNFHYKEIVSGAIIKMSAISATTADGNIFNCTMDILVVDN